MPRKFSDEQIAEYLDSRPGWAVLSTIDKDGFPHSVPLGYFRLGRDIVMGVRDGTRKVANVENHPNASGLPDHGSSMAHRPQTGRCLHPHDTRPNTVVELRRSNVG